MPVPAWLQKRDYVLWDTADVIVKRVGEEAYAVKTDTREVITHSTDHAEVIQKAIDHLTEGRVFVREGVYTFTRGLKLKPGVSIEGVFPRRKNVEPTPPDDSKAVIEGGTVFKSASSDITALMGDNLIGVELRNLAFKGFKRVMDFGGKDTLGMAFSRIENIYIDNAGDVAIKITNFQHLRISHIKAIVPSGSRFMHLVNDHYNWAGGNSVIDDIYVNGGAGADGVILFEAINSSLNLIEVIRPQVNMWDSDGLGSGIKIDGSHGVFVGRIGLYGVDVEGGPEVAIKLVGYVESCFIKPGYTDAEYYVKGEPTTVNSSTYNPRYNIVFIDQNKKIDLHQQNIVIASHALDDSNILGNSLVLNVGYASGEDRFSIRYFGKDILKARYDGLITLYGRKTGVATLSGDGSTTDFLIGEHGLSPSIDDPSKVVVKCSPASPDAISASPLVCYLSDENSDGKYESIRVKFSSAPPSGTDNVKVVWEAVYIG